MPPTEKSSPWIVVTTSDRGAWYNHRSTTLSQINSHTASIKADRRRENRHLTPATQRAKKLKRRDNGAARPTPQSRTDGDVRDCPGEWSIEELSDIFDKDAPAETEARTPSSQRVQRSNEAHASESEIASHSRTPSHASDDETLREIKQDDTITIPLHAIPAVLDPFLKLPLEMGPYEKSLMHFYLTEGRQLLFGTLAEPAYCPALHVAHRGVLERSRSYVYTHLAMAEYLLCKLRNSGFSVAFFRLRAEAYKTVSNLLRDPRATFDQMLCGLVMLQVGEFTIGQRDLQSMHLNAMHDLVERHGGTRAFLLAPDPTKAMIDPHFYSNQFVFAAYSESFELGDAIDQFVEDLRRIRHWVQKISCIETKMDSLKMFLERTLQNPGTSHSDRVGGFILVFSLCMTFVEFDLPSEACSEFLQQSHDALQRSVDMAKMKADQTFAPHPCVATSLISKLRQKFKRNHGPSNVTSPDNQDVPENLDVEVSIANSAINATKVYPKLGHFTQSRLSRILLKCALAPAEPTMAEGISEPDLDDLAAEIFRNSEVEAGS